MLRLLIQLLFVSVFLVACTQTNTEKPLRIASSPWPGYEPLYLARDLGYFDSKKVNLFELPSSDITMESFRNRSTDLATLTLDETLELIYDGIPLRILLIMDISNGGDAVMVKPEIKTLSDIKGKRISIVNIPLGLYMLSRLLDKAGLKRSDVEVFPMADTYQLDFYKKGKADVVITYDPVKIKLAEEGMHVIFDSSDIPNEIFDLLLVHEDVYQRRRDDLCHITRQWFKTLNYMKNEKEMARKSISKRLGINESDYDPMMNGLLFPSTSENRKLLMGTNPGLLEPAQKLSSIMMENQQLKNVVDTSIALNHELADCFQ